MGVLPFHIKDNTYVGIIAFYLKLVYKYNPYALVSQFRLRPLVRASSDEGGQKPPFGPNCVNIDVMESRPKNAESVVDIGGEGEYFSANAKENPDKNYIILNPKPLAVAEKPSNLHIIQWRSDVDSSIPLASNSIDEANINFLMGEIHYKEKPRVLTVEIETARYQKLLTELKKILKNKGVVVITDARANMEAIKKALISEGYSIVSEPLREKDENKTVWTKYFNDMFKSAGRPETESFALPMTIRACVN